MKKIDLLSIGITIFFLWAILFQVDFLEVFDLKIMDFFYKVRGKADVEPSVVVVGIDEYSLSALEVDGDTWPWKRDVYGKLLEKIFADGAKVAAFDVSFTEAGDDESDSYFTSTLLMYGNVVLGTYLINDKSTYMSYDRRLRDVMEENTSYIDYAYKMDNFKALGLLNPFRVYKIRPVYEPFATSAYSASYEIGSLDADGIVRRIPLLVVEDWSRENAVSSGIFPHMDVITAALFSGVSPTDLVIDFSKKSVVLKERVIPFDSSGYMHLWYYGRGNEVFKEVPFYDVMNGKFEPGTFRDKVVIVGYTATAKGLYDLRITPFSTEEAGVFVHANAVENLIRNDFIAPFTPFNNAIVLIVVMSIVVVLTKLKGTSINTILLIIPIAFLVVSYVMFLNRMYIGTFYPIAAVLVVGITKTLGDFLKENAEKRKMKEFLYRYVPDKVAEILIGSGELKLGGETRDVVVLFSDIKGFTSRSEKLTPEEVVAFLNVYLTQMSEVIRYKYDGMIDKFIGDAIMAIFGAPVSYGNEIERALRCALDMRKALRELDERLGLDLDSGIGIHYGPAIIGNIGAPFRMDYTCIGDTVNTASRIEHLTREVDAEIIVSEEIVKRTEIFEFEYLGSYSVKGKSEELRLYKLVREKVD